MGTVASEPDRRAIVTSPRVYSIIPCDQSAPAREAGSKPAAPRRTEPIFRQAASWRDPSIGVGTPVRFGLFGRDRERFPLAVQNRAGAARLRSDIACPHRTFLA